MERQRLEIGVSIDLRGGLSVLSIYVNRWETRNNSFDFKAIASTVHLLSGVYWLDWNRIAIDVDQCPKGAISGDSTKKDAALFTIDAIVNVSQLSHVEEEDILSYSKSFSQSFGPISWFVGEVRTGIFR